MIRHPFSRSFSHPIRPVNVYPGHEGYHPPAPSFRIER
jgi:hypothetical protein